MTKTVVGSRLQKMTKTLVLQKTSKTMVGSRLKRITKIVVHIGGHRQKM